MEIAQPKVVATEEEVEQYMRDMQNEVQRGQYRSETESGNDA